MRRWRARELESLKGWDFEHVNPWSRHVKEVSDIRPTYFSARLTHMRLFSSMNSRVNCQGRSLDELFTATLEFANMWPYPTVYSFYGKMLERNWMMSSRTLKVIYTMSRQVAPPCKSLLARFTVIRFRGIVINQWLGIVWSPRSTWAISLGRRKRGRVLFWRFKRISRGVRCMGVRRKTCGC